MKILVIQLARLGDILSSAPAINALRRTHRDAEIHILVRSRFKFACAAIDGLDAVWELNSKEIFKPIFLDNKNFSAATDRMSGLLTELKKTHFDKIINLSFSPLSSFLSYALDPGKRITSGYTRHRDGYLDPNDDASSYFYAQVGVGKYNRIHVADLFAQVANVELSKEDWRLPESGHEFTGLSEKFIVAHIGASQDYKSLPASVWSEVFEGLSIPIVMVGDASEEFIANEILQKISNDSHITNLVGKTQFQDLFGIIKKSVLLIGVDSAPVHIASLSGTRCLNLSCASVNFWETGPRSRGSRVIFATKTSEIETTKIIGEVKNMLDDGHCGDGVIEVTESVPSYNVNAKTWGDFEWRLISGLYLGTDLPQVDDYDMVLALAQLRELNTIVTQQTHLILERSEKKIHSDLITRAEAIIESVKRLCPGVAPLIDWYQVQKIRIPPGEIKEIAKSTLKICKGMEHILSLYLGANQTMTGRSHENFKLESIPDFE